MNLKKCLALLAAGLLFPAIADESCFAEPPAVSFPKMKAFQIDGKFSAEEEQNTA